MKKLISVLLAAALVFSLSACGGRTVFSEAGDTWRLGFAFREIPLPETDAPLYIAGYKNGKEITGVRDLPRASAVWLDAGSRGVLLIGVDCVALSSDTVERIRSELKDFIQESGCGAVNVFATHTHESVDTLGLWGPICINGKNPEFQEALIAAAAEAGRSAYARAEEGRLFLGEAEIGDLLRDSREPQVYDSLLRQLRFVPESGGAGIRLLFCPAHAEAMRSGNTLVSRDYPGVLCDAVKDACGDDALFVPGAVGGLIMTRELTEPFDAEENVTLTGRALAERALSIPPEEETEVTPALRFSEQALSVPLDNTLFLYYRFLGILGTRIAPGKGATGYEVRTTLSVLALGDVLLCMVPGELFPELVLGEGLGEGDPEPLSAIAAEHGIDRLLIVGLCNDELGYVVPPSGYLINDRLPYIEPIEDETGENHYEETNSVGRAAAAVIAEGFRGLLEQLPELPRKE